MRIKEVSQITGLTEKTIRFYEEKLLIHPDKTETNGRIFRSYTDQDIDKLNLVAGLRKLDFTIADIIAMRDKPEQISEILKQYRQNTSKDLQFKSKVMERLEQIDYGSVSSIQDIVGCLMEIAVDRPLPTADAELQFYKIDGLTREEMDKEVQGYYEQQSLAHMKKIRRKIRNASLLYAASIVMSIILGLLIWRNTYYLGYIPSFQDNLGWRSMLIPLFALFAGAISYVFIKMLRNIRRKDEATILSGLRGFRSTALVLLFSLSIGVTVSAQSFKSLEGLKMEAATTARQEWYKLYRMSKFMQWYYFVSPEEEIGDNSGFGLYVNQTCYNFPWNNNDRLYTRMSDLLIWSYDLIFQELRYTASKASPGQKEQFRQLLDEINSELMEISREISDKPDSELAELTRYDNQDATVLRSRINEFAQKYVNETEKLFKSIN